MDKPTPKRELAIERKGDYLHIYTASEDAHSWVKTNCTEFSVYLDDEGSYIIIRVNPLYDFDEVYQYIMSYNKQAAPDNEHAGGA